MGLKTTCAILTVLLAGNLLPARSAISEKDRLEAATGALLRRSEPSGDQLGHPYLKEWCDPAGDIVLARFKDGVVTDLDLYLYLQMLGHFRPSFFKDIIEPETDDAPAADDASTTAAVSATRRAIHDFVRLHYLAQRAPAGAAADAASALRARYYLIEPAKWVWITETLKPQIDICPVDRQAFYRREKELFHLTPSVRARIIFRKLDDDAALSAEMTLKREINRIAAEIAAGRSFAEAARKYSQAPSASGGGLLDPLIRGQGPSALERVIFDLEPGEMSAPFKGPGGYYLAQCLEVVTGRRPLDEVREDIDWALKRGSLAQLYRLETKTLAQRTRSMLDYAPLHQHAPRQTVIRVGQRAVTAGLLIEAFPEVFANFDAPNFKSLTRIQKRLHSGEAIAQEVERLGLGADRRLRRAAEIAALLVRAEAAQRELAENCRHPRDKAELRRYYDERPAQFALPQQIRVIAVSATAPKREALDANGRNEADREAREALTKLLTKFQAQSRAHLQQRRQRETQAPPPEDDPSSPLARRRFQREMLQLPPGLTALKKKSTTAIKFAAADRGFVTAKSAPALYRQVESLAEGEFTPAHATPTAWVCHYVDRVLPPRELTFERAGWRVRESFIKDQARQQRDALYEQLDREARIEFHQALPAPKAGDADETAANALLDFGETAGLDESASPTEEIQPAPKPRGDDFPLLYKE